MVTNFFNEIDTKMEYSHDISCYVSDYIENILIQTSVPKTLCVQF